MIARGFKQSKIDMCVYYRGKVSLLIYTDDGIFIGPNQKEIQESYDLVLLAKFVDKKGTEHRAFKMSDEGDLAD